MNSGTEKRPNPCNAPLARFLIGISRPLSGETAKHYRQRKDAAIVRAVPKPDKRRRKIKAKIIRPPKQARQRERAEPEDIPVRKEEGDIPRPGISLDSEPTR